MYTLYTAIRTYPHPVQPHPHPPCDVHSIHSYTYLPPPSAAPPPPTLQCTLYTQLYVPTPTQCSPSPTHLAMYTLYTAIRTYPHPVQSQPHPPCNVYSIHSYTYLPHPVQPHPHPPCNVHSIHSYTYLPPTQYSPTSTHLAMYTLYTAIRSYTYLPPPSTAPPPPSTAPPPPTLQCTLYTQLYVPTPTQYSLSPTHLVMYTLYTAIHTYPTQCSPSLTHLAMYTLYTAICTYPHQVQSQPHLPCNVHSIHSYTYLPPPSAVPAPPTLQCTLYTQLYVPTPTQCSPSPTHLAMSSSVRGRVSSVSALSGSSLACWNWCSCSRSNNRCMLDFRCFNCIHCEQEGGGGGG